jgi:hypothetical protein
MSYKSILRKLKSKRKLTKGRLDLFDVDIDRNPFAIGLLPHFKEWTFETPNRVLKLFYNFVNF